MVIDVQESHLSEGLPPDVDPSVQEFPELLKVENGNEMHEHFEVAVIPLVAGDKGLVTNEK